MNECAEEGISGALRWTGDLAGGQQLRPEVFKLWKAVEAVGATSVVRLMVLQHRKKSCKKHFSSQQQQQQQPSSKYCLILSERSSAVYLSCKLVTRQNARRSSEQQCSLPGWVFLSLLWRLRTLLLKDTKVFAVRVWQYFLNKTRVNYYYYYSINYCIGWIHKCDVSAAWETEKVFANRLSLNWSSN